MHSNIEEHFNKLSRTRSDINEHLETLKRYASLCETIVELGVAKPLSTWAFIAAKPKTLISVDIVHPISRGGSLLEVEAACSQENIDFKFLLEDSRKVDLPEHDLLFIDTLHKYEVVKEELRVQSSKTRKYIIFHDTVTYGTLDEFGGGPGLNKAIDEFLSTNKNWIVKEVFYNNNGLTVLEKQ